jgi:hypothetical protein
LKIEHNFLFKLKALLRKRAARSIDAISQALGDIVSLSRSQNVETSSKLPAMRLNKCDTFWPRKSLSGFLTS